MNTDRLMEMLERSKALGFLGPGDVAAHVRHSHIFDDMIGEGDRVLDLGSGGGLPGLVIAVGHPMIRLTLLDANERRIAFLRDAVRQLGVDDRVDTVLGRAEELARLPSLREQFDVVVARSFGAPAATAECAAAFLRLGGRLLVSEPADTPDRWPIDGLQRVGLEPGEVHRSDHATVREMARRTVGLENVPRRVGLPARRPLF